MKKPAHTLHTLISALNARATLAGCAVRAEAHTLDRTWGDHEGIAIIGGAQETERAVSFARAYFEKHIAPKRCYDAQYAWNDKGGEGRRLIGLVYYPCAE